MLQSMYFAVVRIAESLQVQVQVQVAIHLHKVTCCKMPVTEPYEQHQQQEPEDDEVHVRTFLFHPPSNKQQVEARVVLITCMQ
jgi:hypothetical protein